MFQFALTIKGSKLLPQVSGRAAEMLSASKRYVHSTVFLACREFDFQGILEVLR